MVRENWNRFVDWWQKAKIVVWALFFVCLFLGGDYNPKWYVGALVSLAILVLVGLPVRIYLIISKRKEIDWVYVLGIGGAIVLFYVGSIINAREGGNEAGYLVRRGKYGFRYIKPLKAPEALSRKTLPLEYIKPINKYDEEMFKIEDSLLLAIALETDSLVRAGAIDSVDARVIDSLLRAQGLKIDSLVRAGVIDGWRTSTRIDTIPQRQEQNK